MTVMLVSLPVYRNDLCRQCPVACQGHTIIVAVLLDIIVVIIIRESLFQPLRAFRRTVHREQIRGEVL